MSALMGEEQTLQEFTGWDEAGILWVENIQSLQELKWKGFETERSKIVQEQQQKNRSPHKKHRGQGKQGLVWVKSLRILCCEVGKEGTNTGRGK